MTASFNRRQVLRALGLAPGALFLPSIGCGPEASSSSEGPTTPPQRLVVFFSAHGTVHGAWEMHSIGGPLSTRWTSDLRQLAEGDFSTILRPLHPWRDRITVLDGLALVSAELDPIAIPHTTGPAHSMSGVNAMLVGGTPLSGGRTVDQLIADHIARPDQLKSLEVQVGAYDSMPISYREAGLPLPAESRPHVLAERIFGTDLGATGAAGSVLDDVQRDFEVFAEGLPASERARLEEHRDFIRDIENRLAARSAQECVAPETHPELTGDFDEDFGDIIHLVTAAFACDMTRVVTLNLSTLAAERVRDGFRGDVHFDFAHRVLESEDAEAAMIDYGRLHSGDFAALLAALDSVPEGDGTLLDNTTVVWAGELGNGIHEFQRWPVVIAGGRGFNHGSLEYWPSTTPVAHRWLGGMSEQMGVPHQKLLVTLARSFGMDLDRVGIESIAGTGGELISCTGPLDGLLF